MLVKIENSETHVRDIESNAILNTDRSAYQNYVAQREAYHKRKNEIKRQADEINNLKCELQDIKCMLAQLLNKGQ
jgi:ABC-type transporter lipoprotein component MlaA